MARLVFARHSGQLASVAGSALVDVCVGQTNSQANSGYAGNEMFAKLSFTVARLFVRRQPVARVAGALDGIARVLAALTAGVVQTTPIVPDKQMCRLSRICDFIFDLTLRDT